MTKWIDYTGISVSAIVYHPEKWVLYGLRTEQCRDEWNKRDNRWGGLEFGETIQQGIIRELEEEFGRTFDPQQIHKLWYREQLREHNGVATHRIAFYHCIILRGTEELKNMEPHKHSELRYFPLDQLPQVEECHSMIYPTLKEFQSQIEQLTGKSLAI